MTLETKMTVGTKIFGAALLTTTVAAFTISVLKFAGIAVGSLTPGGATALWYIFGILSVFTYIVLRSPDEYGRPDTAGKCIAAAVVFAECAALITFGILGLTGVGFCATMSNGWAIALITAGGILAALEVVDILFGNRIDAALSDRCEVCEHSSTSTVRPRIEVRNVEGPNSEREPLLVG
jgi:hypothetical protein